MRSLVESIDKMVELLRSHGFTDDEIIEMHEVPTSEMVDAFRKILKRHES